MKMVRCPRLSMLLALLSMDDFGMRTVIATRLQLVYSVPYLNTSSNLNDAVSEMVPDLFGTNDLMKYCWDDYTCLFRVNGDDNYTGKATMITTKIAFEKNALDIDVECCNSKEENKDSWEVVKDLIDVLDTHLLIDLNATSYWTVHDRSMNETMYFNDPASVQSMILTSANLSQKKRKASIITERGNKAEVWSYTRNDDVEENNGLRTHKALFVNDVLQMSTEEYTLIHAEAFVHPALLSHARPQHILIVSPYVPLPYIREILKHENTTIDILGVDLAIFRLAQEFFPEIDDCSEVVNVNNRCSFETSRVNGILNDMASKSIEDLLGVFDESSISAREDITSLDGMTFATEADGDIFRRMTIDAYNAYKLASEEDFAMSADQYDVMLIDIPSSNENIAQTMFGEKFHLWLLSMSTDESVFVINAGHAPTKATLTKSTREQFILTASRYHDDNVYQYYLLHPYDESFAKPLQSTFLLCLTNDESVAAARFFRTNNAHFDLDMATRLAKRVGSLFYQPTIHYDGPVHQMYSKISRSWESWFCWWAEDVGNDYPACTEFLYNLYNPDWNHERVEVRWDPIKGRSLFAAEDIPKGHYVGMSDVADSIIIDVLQWKSLFEFVEKYPSATMYQELINFLLAYGYETDNLAMHGWAVSTSSTNTFINHACAEEGGENVGSANEIYAKRDGEYTGFIPPLQRRTEITGIIQRANKDIKKGDEFRMEYRDFRSDMQKHPSYEEFLANQICSSIDKKGFVKVDRRKPDHIEL